MRVDYTPGRAFERTEGCDCDRDGFRRVAPGYVQAVAPGDLVALHEELTVVADGVESGLTTFAEWEAAEQAYRSLAYAQAVASDCVFPCPRCKPAQYQQWRNGCFTLGHKRASCDVCGPNRAKP